MRIIVALDTASTRACYALIAELRDLVWGFKLGLEFFAAHGPNGVGRVVGRGERVMLDLKLHDIPRTVGSAAAQVERLGVAMMTVHAAGGREMMDAAVEAAPSVQVLGVTVLTSEHDGSRVPQLAFDAMACGCGGVVCSPREVAFLRSTMPSYFRLVTPGIRAADAPPDDQARTATAAEAVAAGADYLVIGRPITEAPDPRAAVEALLRRRP